MKFLFQASLASVCIAASALEASQIRPVDLTTEMRHNPLGIDAPQPRFAWTLSATDKNARGLMESAYQISVTSTNQKREIWDSGKIASSQFWQLAYGGPRLQPHTTYVWKARVWDGNDAPTEWSAPATFTTGLLVPADWTAHWIAAEPDAGPSQPAREGRGTVLETPPPPLPIFRHDFRITSNVKQALLFVSGLGQYEVRINGSDVTRTVLNPGWSDYHHRVPSSTYVFLYLWRRGF